MRLIMAVLLVSQASCRRAVGGNGVVAVVVEVVVVVVVVVHVVVHVVVRMAAHAVVAVVAVLGMCLAM
jgi:hypothetical protein